MLCRASYSPQQHHGGHTKVVEAPGGQPLREVGGKQETGEEGEDEVVTVTGQGLAREAVSPAAQKDLHAEKHTGLIVKYLEKHLKKQHIYKSYNRNQEDNILFKRCQGGH